MSGLPDRTEKSNGSGPARPSLNSAVLRRRSDWDFFLRLRDAIQQNHRALERLGR
jgi:hypothetical protein